MGTEKSEIVAAFDDTVQEDRCYLQIRITVQFMDV